MKKRTQFTLLALAVSAVWMSLEVTRIPSPCEEDSDYHQGLAVQEWEVITADGAVLRGRRYMNEGEQPVILAHGFMGNGYEFDLPRRDRNLAVYLARRGYDVWVSSFRGCGREPNLCEAVGWRHAIDHLAAYDVPALIEGVTLRTGRRPVWLGHSMGGMVLYMYLQGATFREKNENKVFAADHDLVGERNRSIAAGIAIGSPPAFHWDRGGFFGMLSHSRVMRAGLKALHALTGRLHERRPHLHLGTPMAKLAWKLPRLAAVIVNHTPAGWVLYNWDNVEPDVAISLLRWGGDDVSSRMAQQGLNAIIHTELRSYDRSYSYTGNMHHITAPIFFVTGSEDAANPETIKKYGYEAVSSREKEYVCFPGYGHTDLVMGKDVHQEVYTAITDWLSETLQGRRS